MQTGCWQYLKLSIVKVATLTFANFTRLTALKVYTFIH